MLTDLLINHIFTQASFSFNFWLLLRPDSFKYNNPLVFQFFLLKSNSNLTLAPFSMVYRICNCFTKTKFMQYNWYSLYLVFKFFFLVCDLNSFLTFDFNLPFVNYQLFLVFRFLCRSASYLRISFRISVTWRSTFPLLAIFCSGILARFLLLVIYNK